MEKVLCFSRREGEKLIVLEPFRHNLTKEAVMALPKIEKDGSITWGGWIHAFITMKVIYTKSNFLGTIFRYDAYND